MNKILIDRELLERVCHVDNSTRQTARRELRTVLAAPNCHHCRDSGFIETMNTELQRWETGACPCKRQHSGTPAMPVKAYYHEAPNEYGGLNKSVGLEVRKQFHDAPLVLESDALARIACLEGEIAKRDARILELESDLEGTQSRVLSLQDQWRKLDAELAAIKAQEPVAEIALSDDGYKIGLLGALRNHRLPIGTKLYAAPVSEAKAQGVVQWPDADEIMQMAFEEGQPADDASGYYFELEEFDLFIERLISEVARLNAAPAQQPKCKTCDDNGMIGGPSFYAPDDGGEPCPDCSAPVQQVSVPDERAAFEREDRYIVIKRSDMDRIPNQKVVHSFLGALGELSAHSVRIPQRKFLVIESDWPEYDPAWKFIQDRVQGRPILDAAPAAPAADAGLIEALGYQALFDAIAAATSVYANGAINISVQAFRDALAASRAKGVV